MLSTVTIENDNMDKQMHLCDAIYDWHCPCPHCGAFQPLYFFPTKYRNEAGAEATSGQVVFEKRDSVRERAETARYECGECRGLWTTAQKNASVALGKSVCRTALDRKPRRVGFHVSRLLSLFPGGRLESLAESFLLAKDDPLELQSFYNNSLALHWVQRVSVPQDEAVAKIQSCRGEYAQKVVPENAVALVCGIDTQNDGYWYRVRAFAQDKTSWGIEEGFVPNEAALETILFGLSWQTRSGRTLKIWRALIDTGGGREDSALVSRTEEVYEFLRRCKGRGVQFYGAKGSSRSMPTKIRIGAPIEKMPSGKPIPGGLQIVFINTDAMKDELWHRVERTKGMEPGAWYLHADTPESVILQITAEERRIVKGSNEWTVIRRDNHLLDCECLCLAAADPEFFGGVRVIRAPQPIQQPQPQTPPHQPAQPKENPYLRGKANPIAWRR